MKDDEIIAVKCSGCGCAIVPELQEAVSGEYEMSFFVCPYCKKRYMITTTDAELRKNIERQLLNQRVLGVEVGRRTVVTPEEVKQYYDEHKDTLYDRSGLHMGLLVYHPKAPAETVARQIASGEISFAAACAKYSIHPSREKGGDTGAVEWDKLNPEWAERLTKMKPGTVSRIFTTRGFKTQIYLFRPGGGEYGLMTLKQATPYITDILRQPKSRNRFEDYAAQLKKKAVIDIRF